MMSLSQIISTSREAGEEAKDQDLKPCMFDQFEIEHLQSGYKGYLSQIPFLGDYCPNNWKPVDLSEIGLKSLDGVFMGDHDGFGAYMVDSSGFGRSPGEPALSIDQFVEVIDKEYGYGIVETGEFQVKIGLYEKTA